MPTKKLTTAIPKEDAELSSDQQLLNQVQLEINKGTSFNDAVETVTFNAEPYTGLRTAMQRSIYPLSPVPVLSPVQAEMDDILTKGMIQCYREDIKPLLITSSKPISNN